MNNRVFIIAEIGVNHNGSLEIAKDLVDVAVNAGADAVKFQSFNTDKIMTSKAPKADYQVKITNMSESQYDMIKKLELSQQMHIILNKYCIDKNIQFLSTPFDIESLNFLANKLNLSTIKIASGEITNAPLLLSAARSDKKIILSTGMCTLGDIEDALGVLAFGYVNGHNDSPSRNSFKKAYYSKEGQGLLEEKVTLLHCTTEYPAPFEEVNLRVLNTLNHCFRLKVGYSDHTLGIALPLAAVALGATVIEKHITLNRDLPGPDQKASLEPNELYEMIKGIRQIEKALGKSYKKPTISELKNQNVARKSIVAARNIKKGEILTEEIIAIKRPAYGMSPMCYWDILNKPATKSYIKDEVIT